MAKKQTTGATLRETLGSADLSAAGKARIEKALKEAGELKTEAKKDKKTVEKAVPTIAKQMKELKGYMSNQLNNQKQQITNELKKTNSLIEKVRNDIAKIDIKLDDLNTKQDKTLGMLGDITTAIKAVQQAQKEANKQSPNSGGPSILGAISSAVDTASNIKTGADLAKAAAPTKWGKFIAFLEKKAPNLMARVGPRLLSMGAGMTIPGPGWVWTAVNVLGSLALAWEVYEYWKEFNGETMPSSGDKGPSKSKDIEELQRKAQGATPSISGGGGGGSAPSAVPSASGGSTTGVTPSTGSGNVSGPVAFSGSNKPILDTIKKRESGGNYQAQARGSSASGAYQFIDSTWQSLTKKYGIGTEFSRAVMAPAQIQDQIADKYVSEILSKNNNDVSKVPLVWYTGNSQGKISAAAMAANGGLTPEKYQQMWLADYAKNGGTVQTAGGQTPNMVPELPRPSMPGQAAAAGSATQGGVPQGASTPTGGYGPRQAALDNANDPNGMVPLKTASGKSFQVAAKYAQQFQGFVNELEASGYNIRSIGGFSDRNVAGTNQKSYHAQGAAIDINPDKNPMGSQLITDMPQNISAMAAKYGLGWGGDWRSKKDAMHFSAAAGEGGTAQISRSGGGESLVGGLPGGQVMSFGPEGAGVRQMGTGSGAAGGPMAMRMPGMGGAFGGPIGAALGGAISGITSAASSARSSGSIFSGVDYQSNGKPVINPDGSINWGDPDNPADFARASQAMQKGAGRKTETAPTPSAAPKKKEGLSAVDKMKFGRGAGDHTATPVIDTSYGPQQPQGPELPALKAAQLAALEAGPEPGYTGKGGQILEYNMRQADELEAERKKRAQEDAIRRQSIDDADMARAPGERAALAEAQRVESGINAGKTLAGIRGAVTPGNLGKVAAAGAPENRTPPGSTGAPSASPDGQIHKNEMPDAGIPPQTAAELFDSAMAQARAGAW